MKRYLATLLALALILMSLPLSLAQAAVADGFRYEIRGETVVITGYTGKEAQVTVPSRIEGRSVTSIGNGAFRDCTFLTSIVLPAGVTSIGYGAFAGCSSLTDLTIPKGVTEITVPDYENCPSLQNIFVAEGNPKYRDRDGLLYSADGETLLRVPAGRTGELSIPEGTKYIADRAAYDCDLLTASEIPEDLVRMGRYSFGDAIQLSGKIQQDEAGVRYMGDSLFSASRSLAGAYTLRPGTGSIAPKAFEGCTELTVLIVPDSVTRIGSLAFHDCTSLAFISLPEGVLLGQRVFDNTGYYRNAAHWDEREVLYLGSYLIGGSVTLSGAYTVRPGTKTIAPNAMYDCAKLTELVLPEGVTDIGKEAFMNCTSLTRVTLPKSIAHIEEDAFAHCPKLKVLEYAGSPAEWEQLGFTPGGAAVICGKTPGDPDGDGNITSTDARLALQVAVNKIGEGALLVSAMADVDGDGRITSTDARLILQHSVGKISEWP